MGHLFSTSLLAAVVCTALCACSSKAERIESGLRKAAEYAHSGNPDKAGIEVRNVLQMDPKNAAAYLIAAQLSDGRSDLRNAYANYTKVLELQPDLLDAQVGLAAVYVRGGDLERARQALSRIPAGQRTDAPVRVVEIALAARDGDPERALSEARALVDSAPQLPSESSLLLAAACFSAKDSVLALRVIDKALASDPKNIKLLQMGAEIASDKTSDPAVYARAESLYKAATAAAPARDELWASWAMSHLRRGETEKAEAVLREALRRSPDDSARALGLLRFLVAFRGAEAAEKEFTSLIAARPKDVEIRFAYVELLAQLNRNDDVRKALLEIVELGKDAPGGIRARAQIAGLDLASGNDRAAREALADVLKVSPSNASALVLRARMALKEQRNVDAITDLRAARRDDPASVEIVTLLAQAHRVSGESQLAREAIVDAVKFRPEDPQLHLLLAADMASAKDFAGARAKVEDALRIAPRLPAAQRMKYELAMAQSDFESAGKVATAMQAESPREALGYLLLARTYLKQDKPDAALKQFDKAAEVAPANGEALIGAVGLLSSERRFAEARERIERMRTAAPSSPLPDEMLGEQALAEGNLDEAERRFTILVTRPSATPAMYRNLAYVLVRRNKLEAALQVLQKGEAAFPKDASLATARAEWLARYGRTDESIALYESILRRTPGDEKVANNLAFILADVKGGPAALDRALEVAQRFETSRVPGYLDTLAMVHYRRGSIEKCLELLHRAAQLAPDDPMLQLHLGMATVRHGEVQQGKDLIRQALQGSRELQGMEEARLLLAQK